MGRRLLTAGALAVTCVLGASCSDSPAEEADPDTASVAGRATGSDPERASEEAQATGEPRSEIVVDLSGHTSTEWPISGLLAVALSDDGRHLVALHDGLDRTVTLWAFPYSPDARLSPDDGRVVMKVPHPYVHSGGGLAFDASGDLFVSLGAFRHADLPLGPQNPDGVVVRVPARYVAEVDAGPFTPAASDLVARGLRNPWRMWLDRDTDTLWIGDVGDGTAEEVNRVPATRTGDQPPNFGFPFREGATEMLPPAAGDGPFIDPLWFHGRDAEQGNSIVGGPVYRGGALGELSGTYLFTDYLDNRLFSLPIDGADPEATQVGTLPPGPISITVDPEGELYVLTGIGDVHRLEPAPEGEDAAFTARRIGSIGVDGPPVLEATSLFATPDGSALLASERGGRITRLVLDTERPEMCGFRFVQLPQRPAQPAAWQRHVTTTRRAIDEYAARLPVWLADDAAEMSAFYEAAEELGSTKGWRSEELGRLLAVAAWERGPHAGVPRSESRIQSHLDAVCG